MEATRFKSVQSIQHFKEIQEGTWLWVWQPTKIPPHIGISKAGSYFSLKFNEVERQNVADLFSKAKNLGLPILLVQVPNEESQAESIQSVFAHYMGCSIDLCSCLHPILVWLKLPTTYVFHDLIAFWKSRYLLKTCGINLPVEVSVPYYTTSEVQHNFRKYVSE